MQFTKDSNGLFSNVLITHGSLCGDALQKLLAENVQHDVSQKFLKICSQNLTNLFKMTGNDELQRAVGE